MKNILVLLIVFVALICCDGSPGKMDQTKATADSTAEADPDHEGEKDVLHIPPEKQKGWGLTFHSARLESVFRQLTLPGVLELNQNKTAQISSFAEGKVVSLSVDLGTRVRRGQKLLTMNSPEFAQTQADFLRAKADLNLSRKEYERAERLLKEKAIEEKEFLRRQAENEKLGTELGALGSKLHSFGFGHDQIETLIQKCSTMDKDGFMCEIADPNLPLLSPLAGTVIFRDAVIGQHVERDKILISVSDLGTLWAQLDAFEQDLPKIRRDSRVSIVTDLYGDRTFQGKITYISDLIDPKLRTAKIRVEVKNPEGLLKPNMYIQGLIQTIGEGQQQIVIPEAAVQNLNGEKIVFVKHEEDEFILRHVRLGEKVEAGRIILDGLEEGEVVVVSGAFSLKSEMGKDSRGHDHAH